MAKHPTRRSFLHRLAAETLCLVDEIRGRPQMRLRDLSEVEDDVMATMVPVAVESGALEGREGTDRTGKLADRLPPDELVVVSAIDGRSSVQSIAARVADELDLDDDRAFDLVRRVFVDLAAAGMLRPRAAHEHTRPGPR